MCAAEAHNEEEDNGFADDHVRSVLYFSSRSRL